MHMHKGLYKATVSLGKTVVGDSNRVHWICDLIPFIASKMGTRLQPEPHRFELEILTPINSHVIAVGWQFNIT